MQKQHFIIRLSLSALLLAACWGCSTHTRLDRNWGQAYSQAKAEQIRNPNAGKEPVEGSFDGQSAANALDKYHNSFKKVEPRPQYTINVSGIGR